MMPMLRELWWWAKKIPATIIIVTLSIVTGVLTQTLWHSARSLGLIDSVGYGLDAFRDGDYLNIITGVPIAPEPLMYIVMLLPIALGGGFLEYKYGTLRMLGVLLATHIGAVIITAVALHLLEPTKFTWITELALLRDVGLSNAGFGALGVATAALPWLWRRRSRAFVILYCLAMILFVGFIWDVTHFVAFMIGIVIGPWVIGRKFEKPSFQYTQQEARNFVALLMVFFALTKLISQVTVNNTGPLAFDTYSAHEDLPLLFFVGFTLLSLSLAYGLYAGRRVAWRLSVGASALLLVVGLFLDFDLVTVFNLSLCLIMLVVLLIYRKAFFVRPDKQVSRSIYLRLFRFAILLFLFNAIAIFAIRDSFTPAPSFFEAIEESVYQIFNFTTGEFKPTTPVAYILTDSINYSWLAMVVGSIIYLISSTYRMRDGRNQFAVYDELLHSKGTGSIGWMTRWDGMSYWVNSSKTAGFAYRLENNVAIVLGDPVGSRQAVTSAIDSFTAMCERRGWRPVYFSVSEQFRSSVRKQNLKAIMIGEDTVIELKDLSFTGKSWQSVRSSINQAVKLDINMRVVKYSEAPVGLRDQLNAIAQSWVQDKSLPEMGFTLGTLKEAADPEVRMHIAVDMDGTVHGMTSWMPVYKSGNIVGWTIDIMQRRLDDGTMRGVMEFLIAESAMTFKQEGYEIISLSAAPLSHSGKANGPIERVLDIIAARLEPHYGFKSLYNFKKKFQPRHDALYLCYSDEAQLPAIGIAISKAYMPPNVVRELVASRLK